MKIGAPKPYQSIKLCKNIPRSRHSKSFELATPEFSDPITYIGPHHIYRSAPPGGWELIFTPNHPTTDVKTLPFKEKIR